MRPISASEFWAKLVKQPNGCWIWQGCKDAQGYGRLRQRSTSSDTLAHRVAYKLTYGEVPEGLVVDHLCRNTSCCNPKHLQAVPHIVNVQRGQSGKRQASKTACKSGHPFDMENTGTVYRAGKQGRYCKACARRRSLNFYYSTKTEPAESGTTFRKSGHLQGAIMAKQIDLKAVKSEIKDLNKEIKGNEKEIGKLTKANEKLAGKVAKLEAKLPE